MTTKCRHLNLGKKNFTSFRSSCFIVIYPNSWTICILRLHGRTVMFKICQSINKWGLHCQIRVQQKATVKQASLCFICSLLLPVYCQQFCLALAVQQSEKIRSLCPLTFPFHIFFSSPNSMPSRVEQFYPVGSLLHVSKATAKP